MKLSLAFILFSYIRNISLPSVDDAAEASGDSEGSGNCRGLDCDSEDGDVDDYVPSLIRDREYYDDDYYYDDDDDGKSKELATFKQAKNS